MNRRSSDLLFVALLAVAGVAFAFANSNIYLMRATLGLLLVLVLPGYALTAVLHPERTLSLAEHSALTVGLSLATAALGGLLLHWSSLGLRAETWSLVLGSVTLVGSMIAVMRRARLFSLEVGGKSEHATESSSMWPTFGQWLLFSLAVVVVVGAIQFGRIVAHEQPRTEIVQLWLVPGEDQETQSMWLGVMTNAAAPRQFALWVERGGYKIQEWPRLELQPGEKWETVLALDPNAPGTGPVEALLYRLDAPDVVYRRVSLWPD